MPSLSPGAGGGAARWVGGWGRGPQSVLAKALPGWSPAALVAFLRELDADNSDTVDRAELLHYLRNAA